VSLFRRNRQPRIRVSVFGKTDVGRTREHNEDTFLVADLTAKKASLQPEVRDHDIGLRGSLFIVADGMGGAAAGEIASAMAAQSIYQHMASHWCDDKDASPKRFAYRLKEAVDGANAKIHQYAKQHPELKGMGTTTTAVGVLGDTLYLSQVGDSRAYLVRNGEAIQLTKDQSLMQRLVDAGELTEEEAERSERKNIILQALGPDANIRVDLTHQPIRRGDALVMCSDGLSNQVKKDEIATMVTEDPDLVGICNKFVEMANARGGPDNITVLVARFGGEGLRDSTVEESVGHHVFPLLESDSVTEQVPTYPDSPGIRAEDRPRMILTSALATLLVAAALALAAIGW
jgi:protein phosphatase